MRNIVFLLCIVFLPVVASAQTTATATVNTAVTVNSSSQMQKALRLYPNPADKYVNIYVEWPFPQAFTISVYDYQFDSWIKEIPVDVRQSYQYSLDVSQLPKGKYKVQVKSGSTVFGEDLKVQH